MQFTGGPIKTPKILFAVLLKQSFWDKMSTGCTLYLRKFENNSFTTPNRQFAISLQVYTATPIFFQLKFPKTGGLIVLSIVLNQKIH